MYRRRDKNIFRRLIVLSLFPFSVLSHPRALPSRPPLAASQGSRQQPEDDATPQVNAGPSNHRQSSSSQSPQQGTGDLVIPIGNAEMFPELSDPPFPDGQELEIWMPQCKDYKYNKKAPKVCKSMTQKIKEVGSWQQVFQLGTAVTTYGAGVGVGTHILHDPLATSEGVLNFPVVVSQLTLLMTEVFLIDKTVYTWDPFAVAKLIEDMSIMAAAFSLMSQQSLEVLFHLDKFPNSVHLASSYGGSTLFHAGLIGVHGVQAAVLNWNKFSAALQKQYFLTQGYATRQLPLFKKDDERTKAYLTNVHDWKEGKEQVKLDKNLRDAMQQSREILRCLGKPDPNANVDLNHCKSLAKEKLTHITQFTSEGHGHGHGHGMLAILADIIAHGVSLPTFFIAWVMSLANLPVSGLAVSWVIHLSSIILLGCLQHSALGDAMKVWKQTGGQAPKGVTEELTSKIDETFQSKYSEYVEKVEFTTRKITARDEELYYVSFYVSVFPDKWKSLDAKTKEEAEMDLRKIAHEVKAYDFSRLDRGVAEPSRIVYWLLSDSKVEEVHDTEPTAGQTKSTAGHTTGHSLNTRGLKKNARKTFAKELNHLFQPDQVTYLLMQHFESKNFDPIMKVFDEAHKSTQASVRKAVAPLKLKE